MKFLTREQIDKIFIEFIIKWMKEDGHDLGIGTLRREEFCLVLESLMPERLSEDEIAEVLLLGHKDKKSVQVAHAMAKSICSHFARPMILPEEKNINNYELWTGIKWVPLNPYNAMLKYKGKYLET